MFTTIGLVHHTDEGSQGRIPGVVATPCSGRCQMGGVSGWAIAVTGRPAMRSPGRAPVALRDCRQRFRKAITRGAHRRGRRCRSGRVAGSGSHCFREAGGIPPSRFEPGSWPIPAGSTIEDIAICCATDMGSGRSPGESGTACMIGAVGELGEQLRAGALVEPDQHAAGLPLVTELSCLVDRAAHAGCGDAVRRLGRARWRFTPSRRLPGEDRAGQHRALTSARCPRTGLLPVLLGKGRPRGAVHRPRP